MRTYTFGMLKPDAVKRGLMGMIIDRIENDSNSDTVLEIEAMRLMHLPLEIAHKLYAEHKGRPYYNDLISFITSGKVVLLTLATEDETPAFQLWRDMMGATKHEDRESESIRGTYAMESPMMENLVHGSDSAESAVRELNLFDWA